MNQKLRDWYKTPEGLEKKKRQSELMKDLHNKGIVKTPTSKGFRWTDETRQKRQEWLESEEGKEWKKRNSERMKQWHKDHPKELSQNPISVYQRMHKWARRNVPRPDICPVCGEKPVRDIHNLSKEYKKNVKDWMWLCKSCHLRNEIRVHPTWKKRMSDRMKGNKLRWG